MQSLKGGTSHQVFLVGQPTDKVVFKKLNPLIMEKPGAQAQYSESEKIAAYFFKAGIPAVPALFQEDDLTWVYPYIAGTPIYYPHLTEVHIQKIASLLAKMHQVGTNLPLRVLPYYDWQNYATKSHIINSSLMQLCKDAKHELCHDKLVISHRDFDPKNVLWNQDGPHIIDWESAGPIHPMEELIALAFEWSGLDQNTCDPILFQAFLKEYEKAGGIIQKAFLSAGLYAFIANYLDWLSFNQSRIGTADSMAEKQLAQNQIAKTLKKIDLLCKFNINRL